MRLNPFTAWHAALLLVFGLVWSGQQAFAQASDDLAQQMYVAYYGRPADPEGQEYWSERFAASTNLDQALDAFGTSVEYEESFGDLGSSELVNNLYQQIFGRDAESEGLNFYTDRLDSGEATLASIAKQIADGAQGDDLLVLNNKIEVANYFTEQVELTGASYTADDIPEVQAGLAVVGASDSSVDSGRALVDDWISSQDSTYARLQAARYLSQASFGGNASSIDQVVELGQEGWFRQQLELPPTLHLTDVLAQFPADGVFFDEQGNTLPELKPTASNSFWQKAIEADDQLRQRMAFALSQILVISSESDLSDVPQTVAHYMDLLTTGAFGNYRDLLEDVTYSPAMSIYLTYLRNQKADPDTGRVPDENYARELMQLFSLGLVELNADGTPAEGPLGEPVEIYDNDDITELAKVFTGLSFSGAGFTASLGTLPFEAFYQPLEMFDSFHSEESKQFLGGSIPAGTDGNNSIDMALDIIFDHPNVGPFIGRQLIQRFVTSDPSTDYVARVSAAFDSGRFTMPSGEDVGSGERGDLAATLAAVLFHSAARDAAEADNPDHGKLREPIVRFTHWARAFNVNDADASNERILRNTGFPLALGQHPYGSPSVFNFYRPGYIAPGTETGDAGMTVPELQIANATSIVGYPNFLTAFVLGVTPKYNSSVEASYVPDYSLETALADDSEALLDHLDALLTHGELQPDTRARIEQALEEIPPDDEASLRARTQLAIVMIMTSPEYIVLR